MATCHEVVFEEKTSSTANSIDNGYCEAHEWDETRRQVVCDFSDKNFLALHTNFASNFLCILCWCPSVCHLFACGFVLPIFSVDIGINARHTSDTMAGVRSQSEDSFKAVETWCKRFFFFIVARCTCALIHLTILRRDTKSVHENSTPRKKRWLSFSYTWFCLLHRY